MGEPQVEYDLFSAGTITGGRRRENVWPGGGIGPPQPIPSFLSQGGSKETFFTYQHKGGLVLHPCVIYQGGLNGGLEPVWVSLLKLPLWEMGSTSKDT